MIGAAPQQYTGILRRVGLPERPKLVIYSLFPGNDLDDARGFAEWQAAGRPTPYALWKLGDRGAALSSGLEGLLERSHAYALLRESVPNLRSPFANRTLTFADGDRGGLAPTVLARAAARAAAGHPDLALVLAAVDDLILSTARAFLGAGIQVHFQIRFRQDDRADVPADHDHFSAQADAALLF